MTQALAARACSGKHGRMSWLIRSTCSLAVALSLAPRASASPSYPSLMRRTLELECAPSCLTCHTVEAGGFATANTPLGINLRRMFKAECCDDDGLVRILGELEAAATDSDKDGTSDVAEMKAGTDPNDPEPAAELACEPNADSGCSAARAANTAIPASAWLIVASACALLCFRRRARR